MVAHDFFVVSTPTVAGYINERQVALLCQIMVGDVVGVVPRHKSQELGAAVEQVSVLKRPPDLH